MRLVVSLPALKQLRDLPHPEAALLMRKLRQFADDPFAPHPWATRLRARDDAVRIRQGGWRAVCRIDRSTQTVVVDAIAHRREVYR